MVKFIQKITEYSSYYYDCLHVHISLVNLAFAVSGIIAHNLYVLRRCVNFFLCTLSFCYGTTNNYHYVLMRTVKIQKKVE